MGKNDRRQNTKFPPLPYTNFFKIILQMKPHQLLLSILMLKCMHLSVDAILNGFEASFGAAFMTTFGACESNFGTAGVLIGDRVIVEVAHLRQPPSSPPPPFQTGGCIRNVDRYTKDSYEQGWTGTVYQHEDYFNDGTADVSLIVLDQPVANLCAAPNAPVALPLPFNVATGELTVTDAQLVSGSTVCRNYGYGLPDESHLHYAYGIYQGTTDTTTKSTIRQQMTNGTVCSNDSGSGVLCKIDTTWRLVGLNRYISTSCWTTQAQSAYATNLRAPKIVDWIVRFLRDRGLTQNVMDAQNKCAGMAMAWESPDIPQIPLQYIRANNNNKIVSAWNVGAEPLQAVVDAAYDWEKFKIIPNSDGTVSLRSMVNGKYVCTDMYQGAQLIANKDWNEVWERYNMIKNADGTVSFRAVVNNKYVCVDLYQGAKLIANKDWNEVWERFRLFNY